MRQFAYFIVAPTGLYLRQDRCQTFLESRLSMEPPNELACMAGQARIAGWECRIEDYPMTGGGWKRVANDLEALKPGLLVLAVTAPTLEADLEAARLAKSASPGAVTSVKAAWMIPEEAERLLENHPFLDIVFLSGYEVSTLDACRAILAGGGLEDVAGLVIRVDGRTRYTGPRELPDNLDELAFPARDLVRNRLYVRPDTGKPRATIQAARGCPYGCSFCLAATVEGGRVRERSAESIVREMTECVERFGIRDFFLRADTFTLHKEWVIGLCRSIIETELKVNWVCNSRVDTLDEERLVWMKKAGCWLVSLGIESGDQSSLDQMSKGTRLEDAEAAVRLCRKHRIKTYAFYILGFPWEDERSIRGTVAFAKKLNSDFFLFHLLLPFPGTAVYSEVSRRQLFKSGSPAGFDHSRAAMATRHLTADRLDRLWRQANWSMYLSAAYLFRVLAGMFSPLHLLNYLRYGLDKIRYLLSR